MRKGSGQMDGIEYNDSNNIRFNAVILTDRVRNFCFNSLSPFLSIVRILSSKATLLQILVYTLFLQFPWLTLLVFPSYFNFHNLTYL